MEQMGTDESNTIFVGDQILTDVWGANRAGIRSVMVKPVKKWHEEIDKLRNPNSVNEDDENWRLIMPDPVNGK